MMAGQPKRQVAFYWCASCGGCEQTVVDLEARILDVVEAVDIVFWPCAMDFKTADVERMADREIAVAFLNGAIRTDEQEHMVKLLRRKAACVIAFGACSAHGGIPALANLTSKKNIFDVCYHRSPTVENPQGTEPATSATVQGHVLRLPTFHETVRKLSDVVEVDYYLPGCPPTSDNLAEALQCILQGNPPPGSAKALCETCKRNDSKPDSFTMPAIKRVLDVQLEPDSCFLVQGVICMGPATRGGCGALCVDGNMPCTGCYGPPEGVHDQGAKMIATLGGILEGDSEEAIQQQLDRLTDAAGTFYRYALSASQLGSQRERGS
jgi:F420-non-reducing hydrogenase small subunit